MRKRSIYNFETEAETGLDKLPVGTTVVIKNYASLGSMSFLLSNNTGLTSATTIAQAVSTRNLTRSLLASDYATATTGGTVKARVSGSNLYLTTNGVNP